MIPVIVLTTLGEDQDVSMAYQLSSNAYIVKPMDLQKFFAMIRQIDAFWLRVVKWPDA